MKTEYLIVVKESFWVNMRLVDFACKLKTMIKNNGYEVQVISAINLVIGEFDVDRVFIISDGLVDVQPQIKKGLTLGLVTLVQPIPRRLGMLSVNVTECNNFDHEHFLVTNTVKSNHDLKFHPDTNWGIDLADEYVTEDQVKLPIFETNDLDIKMIQERFLRHSTESYVSGRVTAIVYNRSNQVFSYDRLKGILSPKACTYLDLISCTNRDFRSIKEIYELFQDKVYVGHLDVLGSYDDFELKIIELLILSALVIKTPSTFGIAEYLVNVGQETLSNQGSCITGESVLESLQRE